jgi:hypothetical protein
MSIHSKALIGLIVAASALVSASASAKPASPYQNWAQNRNNSAGVVFHPRGDYFEVWNNGRPQDIYGVSVIFNYKGVNDRWKSAGEVQVHGKSYVHRNFDEHHHIYFYILGPDNPKSPISEYRTNGR